MQSLKLVLHFVRCWFAIIAPKRPSRQLLEASMADVRLAMLGATASAHPESVAVVTRRIQNAQDLAGLWFLRTDLMAALASSIGEAPACQMLAQVSDRFEGLLPKGLLSRPSPLAS